MVDISNDNLQEKVSGRAVEVIAASPFLFLSFFFIQSRLKVGQYFWRSCTTIHIALAACMCKGNKEIDPSITYFQLPSCVVGVFTHSNTPLPVVRWLRPQFTGRNTEIQKYSGTETLPCTAETQQSDPSYPPSNLHHNTRTPPRWLISRVQRARPQQIHADELRELAPRLPMSLMRST